MKILLLFILFTSFSSIFANFSIGIIGTKVGGEYVFETGNRFPNLSGVTGGSRISFERDFWMGGLVGSYYIGQFEIKGIYQTTGWGVRSGRARDEDFFLFSISQERAHHILWDKLAYYDSVNVYSGTRNFADGIGKSNIFEYNSNLFIRYYLFNQRPWINQTQSGFFLSLGVGYTYNKYIFYDVIQWIATVPIFYQPIGYGLSFSSSILKNPIGVGYLWNFENFYIEFTGHYQTVYIRARDFHKQRNLNFLSQTAGIGFLFNIELGYKLSENGSIFIHMNQNRFFTKGGFQTSGGLIREDILSNYLGRFKAHINSKDWMIDFGIRKNIFWD